MARSMCSHFSPKCLRLLLRVLHPPHIFPDMIKHFLSKSGGSGSNHAEKEEKKDWKVRTTSTITTDVRRWSSANVVAIVRNCPYYCRIQNDEEVLVLPLLNAAFPMMPFFSPKKEEAKYYFDRHRQFSGPTTSTTKADATQKPRHRNSTPNADDAQYAYRVSGPPNWLWTVLLLLLQPRLLPYHFGDQAELWVRVFQRLLLKQFYNKTMMIAHDMFKLLLFSQTTMYYDNVAFS